MSEYVEGEGRGAWTTRGKENGTSSYGLVSNTTPSEYDGASGSVSEWHNRVKRGVRAIDQLLELAGIPGGEGSKDSVFDSDMRERVLAFQHSVGIASTYGYVGPTTMRHLVRNPVDSICREMSMNPRWIWAQISKESGFDPGAQGWETPFDSGLVQCNTRDTNVTLAEAYNPIKAIRIGARRWMHARDEFLADGAERKVAINGAILQHKTPAGAAYYVSHDGEWQSPVHEEYVRLTRQFAREWKQWRP